MKRLDTEDYVARVAIRARQIRRPEGVTFELTYGCNLRCVHCFNPTHRALPSELSTLEVLRLLDQLAEFGVMTVTFTGGEPSLRPDIEAILNHARRQGLLIRLLTNATRVTSTFVALLYDVGAEQVCVSIYGSTAATYEHMTGVPGSYAAFLRGLTMLAESRLPVVVRMPVTTINQYEVETCRRLAESLGLKFQYCLDITPTGNRRRDATEVSASTGEENCHRPGISRRVGVGADRRHLSSNRGVYRMCLRSKPLRHYPLWRNESLHRVPDSSVQSENRDRDWGMGGPQADGRRGAANASV